MCNDLPTLLLCLHYVMYFLLLCFVISWHFFPCKIAPARGLPSSRMCLFWMPHVRGNNDYKIPWEFVFVRGLTLKAKVELVLFTVDGHVSSTKVFWEILLRNTQAPTLSLWPLWWVLKLYMWLCVCMACDQNVRLTEPLRTVLAQALRLFPPLLPSVPQILKTDVTSILSVDTHWVPPNLGFKSSPASIKTNNQYAAHDVTVITLFVMICLWLNILWFSQRFYAIKNVFPRILVLRFVFYHTAICRWRNLRQPSSVWAEKHHHCFPVLWRKWHLPSRHFNQHPWAAIHQHKHPVHSHQPLQSLQSSFPSRPNGMWLITTFLIHTHTNLQFHWFAQLNCAKLRELLSLMRDESLCFCFECRLWRPCVNRDIKMLCTF